MASLHRLSCALTTASTGMESNDLNSSGHDAALGARFLLQETVITKAETARNNPGQKEYLWFIASLILIVLLCLAQFCAVKLTSPCIFSNLIKIIGCDATTGHYHDAAIGFAYQLTYQFGTLNCSGCLP